MKQIAVLLLAIVLVPYAAVATDGVWNYNGSDNWTTTSRWQNSQIADAADGIADFSTVNIDATRVVSLYTNRTIGTILFGDAISPGNDWILQRNPSGILTLDVTVGLPVINIVNRTATVTAAIDGSKGFVKQGPAS